jgi:hypothetical protein
MAIKFPKLPKFKFSKFKFPKLKLPKPSLPSVDDVLKYAQWATYAFIVGRILVYLISQVSKLRFKVKK